MLRVECTPLRTNGPSLKFFASCRHGNRWRLSYSDDSPMRDCSTTTGHILHQRSIMLHLALPNLFGLDSEQTMKTTIRFAALAAGLLIAQLCMAQAPAGAPAGATGLCNDGTYYTGASKQGACRGHKGVKDWYGAPAATPAKTKSAAAPASTPAAAPVPAAAPAPAATPPAAKSASKSTAKTTTAAAGGGPGQVWLNTQTNVYHCPGTQYYGKTKAGAYMTEAEAKAKGAHGDHGKGCN
jgi:Protein of unknown function (DUF3761)